MRTRHFRPYLEDGDDTGVVDAHSPLCGGLEVVVLDGGVGAVIQEELAGRFLADRPVQRRPPDAVPT